MKIKVAAYQGYAKYDQLEENLKIINEVIEWADAKQADILCFPECFLQGYILDKTVAQKVSLDLGNAEFITLLKRLKKTETTIILGIIECENDSLYNTAVILEKGKLIGKYRKHFIHNKEQLFSCGTEFPVFEKNGVKYGINICYDSRFPESAAALVEQGAQLIFCPLNNSLPQAKADEWKEKHIDFLRNKATQSNCLIVSADVVEKSESNTGYGCTCLVNPAGEVIEYLEHSKVSKFIKEIEVL